MTREELEAIYQEAWSDLLHAGAHRDAATARDRDQNSLMSFIKVLVQFTP
jgi:hypothetical protein